MPLAGPRLSFLLRNVSAPMSLKFTLLLAPLAPTVITKPQCGTSA